MCHNINMTKTNSPAKVIEPEILDEQGQVIIRQDSMRTYSKVGALTGFFALVFSSIFLIFWAILTIFIITPVLLLGRLFGLQIHRVRK